MYSSLEKVDIVVKDKEGANVLVQTDHRSLDEVDAEREISVLFALTRILAPRRAEGWRDARVRYVIQGELHPLLASVAAATDAEVQAGDVNVDLAGVPRRPAADLADDAFRGLAAKVLQRERVTPDAAGLAAFTDRVLRRELDAEEDEISYWTAIAELAAFTGEVMRAKYGGRWVDDPKDFADIPFMFQVGDSYMNPVGKSIKCVMHGESEGPVHLLRSLEDADAPQGPLLFSLKPAGWAGALQVVSQPLLPGDDVPLLVFGHDRPNTFAQLMKDGTRELAIDALRAEAVRNLAAIDVEVERIDVEDMAIFVVHGSYFAGEKLLDPTFMKAMHERVGAELLAAAVPEKGRLLVTSAMVPDHIPRLMAVAKGAYERNEGGRQISPTVFLVSEGNACGVARLGPPAEPEPEKKKGFFSRLFN